MNGDACQELGEGEPTSAVGLFVDGLVRCSIGEEPTAAAHAARIPLALSSVRGESVAMTTSSSVPLDRAIGWQNSDAAHADRRSTGETTPNPRSFRKAIV